MLEEKLREFLDEKILTSQDEVRALAEAIHLEPFMALSVFQNTFEALKSANQGNTPTEIEQTLEKTWKRSNAEKTLDLLWKLQQDKTKELSPDRHFEQIWEAVDDYFTASGLLDIGYTEREIKSKMKTFVDRYTSACESGDPRILISTSLDLAREVVTYFNKNFWDWEKTRLAILVGIVKEDVSYHHWKSKGSKLPLKQTFTYRLKRLDYRLPPAERVLYKEMENAPL
jgi:hypothetical protein